VVAKTSSTITCLGTGPIMQGRSVTQNGKYYNYRLYYNPFDLTPAADFGDPDYIDPDQGGVGDVCDLDGDEVTNEPLPLDLDDHTRSVDKDGDQTAQPDAGAYEIQ
jgi:hypothetical protein